MERIFKYVLWGLSLQLGLGVRWYIIQQKPNPHLLLSASVDRHSFCITGFSLSFPSTVANVLNDGCNRSWRFFTSLDSGAQITGAKRCRSKLTVILEKLSFLCLPFVEQGLLLCFYCYCFILKHNSFWSLNSFAKADCQELGIGFPDTLMPLTNLVKIAFYNFQWIQMAVKNDMEGKQQLGKFREWILIYKLHS